MVAPESLCFFGISGGGIWGALLGGTPGIDWQVGFRRLSCLCKSPMDRSSNENWSQSKTANCGSLHAGQRLLHSGLKVVAEWIGGVPKFARLPVANDSRFALSQAAVQNQAVRNQTVRLPAVRRLVWASGVS